MVSGKNAKVEEVKKIKEMILANPIIGIVNMQNLPMAQLQRMRKKLKDDLTIYMSKKRLIKIALEELKSEKPGIEKLDDLLKGMPALMFTKENPFRLYALLQKSKSKAAAKAGQIAPTDIKVTAGPTPFAPGPIISELGAFGLKTKVSDGKIEITEDKVVVEEGQEITGELASLLMRMGIEPMEIGLDLIGVFEDGSIFGKDVLAIDEEEYFNNFVQAETWAFNLAVEAGILNSKTTELLVQKAYRNTRAVSIEANFLTDDNADEILGKAERQMKSVESNVDFSKVPEAKPEEPAESSEKVEEQKDEEKPEEKAEESAPEEKPEEKAE
ncbi:50S ribosomal protein L10 [Candidatus Woesearchaeota archaeon]|nr:50S ribosomal protein L10 [Candidatus Woesearchaeota archaeon]